MVVIPAIDLRDGKCVRLYQGDYRSETVYFDDPVKMAKLWRVQNARILHLVDLDAARGGSADCPHNRDIIRRIREAIDIPIQVGGGIRTMADVEAMLSIGVNRVIIGTAAVQHPDLVTEAVAAYGSSAIVVGIDARNGEVKVQGWQEGSGVGVAALAREMLARGCRRIVYTDISRDGTLEGPNIGAYRSLCEEVPGLKITASGGVGRYEDLIALQALPRQVDSVIVGKALYENQFPCQQFWCWHQKELVDLDCPSSATLRTSAA